MNMINYGKQTLKEDDLNSVIKTLKSTLLTSGPTINKFEKELIKKFGGKFCSVVNNGTSALYILGKALGWKKGDKIITTPLSFLATANCIVNNNARPVFVDIENDTFTLDPEKLEDQLRKKHFKAVIAVDYAGHPCDWDSLKYLSKKYRFKLINDACHSMGSKLHNNQKYATNYSDFVTQSYHPVKAITTGEGGSIFSKDKKIANRIAEIRNQSMRHTKKEGPWYYETHEAGLNFRITDFQCALGRSQLSRIDTIIRKRNFIARKYDKFFRNYHVDILEPTAKKLCSYHLYVINIPHRDKLYDYLKKNHIETNVHYIPIFMHSYYKKRFKFNLKDFPDTLKYFNSCLSIPLYTQMNNAEQTTVMKKIKNFYK